MGLRPPLLLVAARCYMRFVSALSRDRTRALASEGAVFFNRVDQTGRLQILLWYACWGGTSPPTNTSTLWSGALALSRSLNFNGEGLQSAARALAASARNPNATERIILTKGRAVVDSTLLPDPLVARIRPRTSFN